MAAHAAGGGPQGPLAAHKAPGRAAAGSRGWANGPRGAALAPPGPRTWQKTQLKDAVARGNSPPTKVDAALQGRSVCCAAARRRLRRIQAASKEALRRGRAWRCWARPWQPCPPRPLLGPRGSAHGQPAQGAGRRMPWLPPTRGGGPRRGKCKDPRKVTWAHGTAGQMGLLDCHPGLTSTGCMRTMN